MPIVSCPTCGKRYEVADNQLGSSVHCADCARAFVAEKPAASVPPPRSDLVSDERYDDERRPRRRERYEPHRGGLVMAMGIVSILVGGIGLVTGILAWIWGNEDLKKMDAGIMDPEGRSNTQLGKVLGMVGTILHVGGLAVGLCVFFVLPVLFGIAMFGAVSSMPPPPMPATSKSSTSPPIPMPPTAPKGPVGPRGTPKSTKKKTSMFVPSRTVDYLPPRCA